MRHTIITAVEQADCDHREAWHAYAIVNGNHTTMTCMHSHKTEAAAQRCAAKYLTNLIQPLHNAAISLIGDDLYQFTWTDDQGRTVIRRFIQR